MSDEFDDLIDETMDDLESRFEIESIEKSVKAPRLWTDDEIIKVLMDENLTLKEKFCLIRSNMDLVVEHTIKEFYKYESKSNNKT